MKKRIAVLGGVGFIGTHLCRRLLKEGNEVFCIDIRDVSNSPLLYDVQHDPAFHYVHHNIINGFAIRCDEIYNLTAPSMVRYNKALPVDALKTSIVGSINALEAIRDQRARILYASASSVYGAGIDNVHGGAAEADKTAASNKASCSSHRILAEGKHMAELLHKAYRAEFGIDARIARIFNTYGEGADQMDQRVVMKMVVAALQNRDIMINGSGEQIRTFCWVEDVADALVKLMEAPPSGTMHIVNIGGNEEITIKSLAEKIIALTGSRSRIVYLAQRSDDAPRRNPDITAAKDNLKWQPLVSLEEGLKRTIAYAQKEMTAKSGQRLSWVEVY